MLEYTLVRKAIPLLVGQTPKKQFIYIQEAQLLVHDQIVDLVAPEQLIAHLPWENVSTLYFFTQPSLATPLVNRPTVLLTF